jgi:hypothetical protein
MHQIQWQLSHNIIRYSAGAFEGTYTCDWAAKHESNLPQKWNDNTEHRNEKTTGCQTYCNAHPIQYISQSQKEQANSA